MKRIISATLILFISSILYSQTFYKALEPGREQMAIYVGAYDWGPCINKIVINTDKKQNPDAIKASDFEVERYLYQNDTGIRKSSGELNITDAFCSDSKGNRTDSQSKYITLLTEVDPEAENSSPFPGYLSSGVFNNFYNY